MLPYLHYAREQKVIFVYIKYIWIPVRISSITKELFQNSSLKKGEKKSCFSIYSMQESRSLYFWNAEMLKELNKIPHLLAHNKPS